jgi:hypothetical protein
VLRRRIKIGKSALVEEVRIKREMDKLTTYFLVERYPLIIQQLIGILVVPK